MGESKARLADRRRATRSVRACADAAITALVSIGRPEAATEQMVAQPPGVPVTPKQAAGRNPEPGNKAHRRPPPNAGKRKRDASCLHIGISLVLMLVVIASASRAKADDITRPPGQSYDWTGFYLGGHLGVTWGSSNWTAGPGITGSTDLFQKIDTFDNGGSFLGGLQAGFNYVLANRVLIGAEIDTSFPSWPTLPSGVNPFGVLDWRQFDV